MDRVIWITWYDLPARERDAYVDWLHGTHMPALTKRKSVLWAAHYASEPNPSLTSRNRARPLGVSTHKRFSSLSEVPTIAEPALPGYESSQFFGVLARGGTPVAFADLLRRETGKWAKVIKAAGIKPR